MSYNNNGCCPPPPPPDNCCHHIPVIIEKILKPYFNPDGSFSQRKYYQYPVTCFKAVHETEIEHSPTLDETIRRIHEKIDRKQNALAAGDKNVILTRGKDDGLVGELVKVDYLDNARRSRVHVPSEYALFKTLDHQAEGVQIAIGQETARATAAEKDLLDVIRDETARAKNAEEGLSTYIQEVAEKKLDTTIAGEDGLVVKNFSITLEDPSDLRWQKTKLNLLTGNTETSSGSFNILDPIEKMVDEKIKASEDASTKVDQSVFNNVDHNVVVRSDFVSGVGNAIGRLYTTYKDVTGSTQDQTKTVVFKSDDVHVTATEISSNELELNICVIFAEESEVRAMLDRVYA